MKSPLSLLLLCLMLCGCAATPAQTAATEALEATQEQLSPLQLYLPDSQLEKQTGGAATLHPVPMKDARSLRVWNDRLLLVSGKETTALTLLEEDTLQVAAGREMGCYLDLKAPSFRISGEFLSCFDAAGQQTLVLDPTLAVTRTIAAPENLRGVPILSDDGNTLYYCTSTALQAWDLTTGIRRTVKQMRHDTQVLSGLHLNGSVLQCTVSDAGQVRTLFLSSENGLLLSSRDGTLALTDAGSRYYAVFPSGISQSVLFGRGTESPAALTPRDCSAPCVILEQQHSAVTVGKPTPSGIRLDCYDLSDGLLTSTLTLPTVQTPAAITGNQNGCIYILFFDPDTGRETICRWIPGKLPAKDITLYTGPYFTAREPDRNGLAGCTAFADSLAQKYGIGIRIWEEAVASEPWDYRLEPEYLVPVIRQGLEELDACLSAYPRSLLEETAAHFSELSICLVRQIRGSAESGSLSTASGIQFFADDQAFVAIAVGDGLRQALNHELFHVMETHILTDSIAFDSWESTNPSGFSYDYSYAANSLRNSGVYLQEENRAFIDTYSMSFPKEDRARVMEYAMLSGNARLFSHPILQAKLQKVCQGIREAYGLQEPRGSYLWEQYLQ